MADVKWTTEQKAAINIRNSKTLVAAGAGSGKTAVLVERIIKKVIEDKVDIDKMLIVTFTNAAASEMKERIRDRLYEEASKNKELQKQILYLNRSSIMTIDAFCKKAIKDYFYKLDIDPNFKIADNTELELLKLEVIDEVLEELYELTDTDVKEILEAYSANKSDDGLVELILSIYKFIQSSEDPRKWLNEKCEMYNVNVNDFSKTIWGNKLIYYAREVIDEVITELRNASEDIETDEEAKNYYLTLSDDILMLEALRKNNLSWDDYYNEFKVIKFQSLKRAPKMDEETKNYIKSLREKAKDLISKYLRDEVFISTSDEILDDLKLAYSHALGIKKIIYMFDDKFKEKKAEKNLLDFSDIEHLCLKLFNENDDVLADYKERYEEILIDEYQDSNLIQETILNKISKGNVFMVGDVKQSIYKFRQARPELFLEKYNTYHNYFDDEKDSFSENKILLFKNFRSNENIIDEVNFIFKNIMSKDTAEIDYTEEEFLKYGATYYDYDGIPAEFHLIEKSQNEEEEVGLIDSDDEIEDKAELEAKVIASRINDLVGNFDVYDKSSKSKRKAKYSDIVILLRATKGYSDIILGELQNQGIPVYADVKTGYFDNTEVQIILSLLKIIDNPYQDIPLLAVLRSPIGNFDVNELTSIRICDRKCSFYEAMMKSSANGNLKSRAFLEKLNTWREKSRYLTTYGFISFLYDETKYYYYVSLLPDGDARQTNLKVLLKKANEFDNSSYKGLYNFLIFIDNIKENSGDFDSPSELSESDDVVRIMSIHKSKGLEFPIVILAGTSRKFNKRDLQNKIILHQDMGFGFDIINPYKRISYESIPKLALKLQNEQEMLAEEMRILYVALTRAKEKIIITSLVSNIDNKEKAWSSPITTYRINNAINFADWIGNVVLSTSNDWEVVKWKYNDVLKLGSNSEVLQDVGDITSTSISQSAESKVISLINSRFSWKYPYTLSTKIPAKLSVSELKRLNSLEDYSQIIKVKDIELPKFIEDENNSAVPNLSGTDYGTLLHSKMEKLSFKNPNVSEILSDIDDKKLYNKLEKDIQKFLDSDLYKIISSSDLILKEKPFNLSISAKKVFNFEKDSSDDNIMVQGIIDLYFSHDDGFIIVDYKTDKMKSEEEFVKKYKIQLLYYKMALENITNKKVICTYIYSFELGREIRIDFES